MRLMLVWAFATDDVGNIGVPPFSHACMRGRKATLQASELTKNMSQTDMLSLLL